MINFLITDILLTLKLAYFERIENLEMGLQDLVVTPIYLLFFYLLALIFKSWYVPPNFRRYFIPALTLKFIGAISIGLVYQFYYQGGDTFNYWEHGSRWIWEAFISDNSKGLGMIFKDAANPEYFEYYSRIWLRRSDSAMLVIKLSAFFDLLTYHTYSSTALFFAIFSFIGSWDFFRTLTKIYPKKTRGLFFAIFALPSVIIWGSGIMKDSLSLGALLLAFSMFLRWEILGERRLSILIIFGVACWVIYLVKLYILACFIPCLFILVYLKYISRIRSFAVKMALVPILSGILLGAAFFSTQYVVSDSKRYSFENLPKWTMITAYDIGFGTGRDAGSTYSLGNLDGTWQSMVIKFFPAVNVSIFRPYLWESSSLLMLLTSLESTGLLFITFFVFFTNRHHLKYSLKDPLIVTMLIFSIVFAFAVGVSTYNFGTLSRYRVPLLPFYAVLLILFNKRSVISSTKTMN